MPFLDEFSDQLTRCASVRRHVEALRHLAICIGVIGSTAIAAICKCAPKRYISAVMSSPCACACAACSQVLDIQITLPLTLSSKTVTQDGDHQAGDGRVGLQEHHLVQGCWSSQTLRPCLCSHSVISNQWLRWFAYEWTSGIALLFVA